MLCLKRANAEAGDPTVGVLRGVTLDWLAFTTQRKTATRSARHRPCCFPGGRTCRSRSRMPRSEKRESSAEIGARSAPFVVRPSKTSVICEMSTDRA